MRNQHPRPAKASYPLHLVWPNSHLHDCVWSNTMCQRKISKNFELILLDFLTRKYSVFTIKKKTAPTFLEKMYKTMFYRFIWFGLLPIPKKYEGLPLKFLKQKPNFSNSSWLSKPQNLFWLNLTKHMSFLANIYIEQEMALKILFFQLNLHAQLDIKSEK